MKEKTTYGCSMWVDTGDEHPDIFTHLTGIKPTEIKVKGEVKRPGQGPAIVIKQNLWIFKPPVRTADNEWDLCESIVDITDILDEKEVEVRAALRKFDNKGLMLYCNMYHYWIQFRAQPEILYKMQKYNMLLDFSIMSFKDEDEDEDEWKSEDDDS